MSRFFLLLEVESAWCWMSVLYLRQQRWGMLPYAAVIVLEWRLALSLVVGSCIPFTAPPQPASSSSTLPAAPVLVTVVTRRAALTSGQWTVSVRAQNHLTEHAAMLASLSAHADGQPQFL